MNYKENINYRLTARKSPATTLGGGIIFILIGILF